MTQLTQILGQGGPVTKRWLFLGDGFTTADLGLFAAACNRIKVLIQGSLWYQQAPQLGIWRYDAVVDQNDPPMVHAPCTEHPTPIPALPPTRFDVEFRLNGGPCRELGGYDEKVYDEADEVEQIIGASQYDGFDRILVIINTRLYGASHTSTVAWCSVFTGKFPKMALHELGHTFDLNDEYENTCGVSDIGFASPLSDSNIGSNPANLPWHEPGNPPLVVVTKATNSTCHSYLPGPQPKVGAWEGGLYRHKGYYRPSKVCRMRNSTDEFCDVCTDIIAYAMSP